MSITNSLFRLARLSATAKAVSSGSPKKIVRRGKNLVVGRTLARVGFWKRLWK